MEIAPEEGLLISYPVGSIQKQMYSKSVWGKMFLHAHWLNPSIIKPMSCAESVWTGSIAAPENDLMEKCLHCPLLQKPQGTEAAAAQEVITNLTAAIVRRITNLTYNLRIVDFTQADRRNTDIDQGCQRG